MSGMINEPLAGLTVAELREKYPFIMTDSAASHTSQKYNKVSTFEVLQRLRDANFTATAISFVKSRKDDNWEHVKHTITLRSREHMDAARRETVPQILLTNSHNASSSFQLRLGIYRFVCANGLVVGTDTIQPFSIRHSQSNIVETIYKAANGIICAADQAYKDIEMMNSKPIGDTTNLVSMVRALTRGVWDDNDMRSNPAVTLALQLGSGYNPNGNTTLWHAFNNVQSNIMRGGYAYRTVSNDNRLTVRKGKPISSIDRSIRVNELLWNNAVGIARAA